MVNAILAAVLSFLIPGLGQAVAGDIKRGVIFFIIAIILGWVIGHIFTNGGILPIIIGVIYDLYAAYDAYQLAQG